MQDYKTKPGIRDCHARRRLAATLEALALLPNDLARLILTLAIFRLEVVSDAAAAAFLVANIAALVLQRPPRRWAGAADRWERVPRVHGAGQNGPGQLSLRQPPTGRPR
jgi:hypothetical protein